MVSCCISRTRGPSHWTCNLSPVTLTLPKGGKLFTPGVRFLSPPAQAEKMLQQLIAQLEIKRGALLR
jgi:hypothetical protein